MHRAVVRITFGNPLTDSRCLRSVCGRGGGQGDESPNSVFKSTNWGEEERLPWSHEAQYCGSHRQQGPLYSARTPLTLEVCAGLLET